MMTKSGKIFFILLFLSSVCFFAIADDTTSKLTFYSPANSYIQYVGRIVFSNPELPKFWSPGVYIKAKFKGTSCIIQVNDEVLYGKSHNYVSIVIDDKPAIRIKLTGKKNSLKVAENLSDRSHTILICKSTESGIGYLEFAGISCGELLPLPPKPLRKIEFIGNSITCGTGSDLSVIGCDKGEWYDQHNAYMSYGPSTARALNSQWQLTSVSGIGLMKSCCGWKLTMPQVFDKINLSEDSISWDFNSYQPDVVTVCLGQNDGIQDSALICRAYISFIKNIRIHYPAATIVCLTSPMADEKLVNFMKEYLTNVVSEVNKNGDNNIYSYFFSKRFHNGCGDHPDLAEHTIIANELSAFIKEIKNW